MNKIDDFGVKKSIFLLKMNISKINHNHENG